MKRESKKINHITSGIFRLSFLCFIVMVIYCQSVSALDLLGPPAAEIKKWQPVIGIEYSHSTMDKGLINGTWQDEVFGESPTSGLVKDLTLSDLEIDKLNVYLGYGIERDWEIFFRLGAAKSKFGDTLFHQNERFDSDYVPSIGGGLRATFITDRKLKIGAIVQADWTQYTGLLSSSLWANPAFVRMDLENIHAAAGALYQWTKGISIYGGPVCTYGIGGFETDFITLSVDNDNVTHIVTTKYKWDIEKKFDYGAYVGAQIDLDKDFSMNVEYQMTGDTKVFGAGIVWKF